MRVGIVGCGLIGRRRAQTLHEFPDRLVAVSDLDETRAAELASAAGCKVMTDWSHLVALDDLDAVVVCTTNEALARVTMAAVEAGKHVLVEKPMARDVTEAEAIRAVVARHPEVFVKVGYSHRHHRAVARAHALCLSGGIGEVLFARCRYGHGGRPGYEHEWRARRDLSGGGELLDQGVHAIDLFRWFVGEFTEVAGMTSAYVWTRPDGQSVEDNAFALFRTATGQVAVMHASWTQWKNLFSLEVFGRDGYLLMEGLGGSYGPERLTLGRRNPNGGPPDEHLETFDGPDPSWAEEWREFRTAVAEQRPPLASHLDGLAVLQLVAAVYESDRSGRVVRR